MRNFGIVEGRLTREPAVFTNSDGSRKIKLTIAAQDNFRTKGEDGKSSKNSQYVQLEAFVAAGKTSNVYELMHQGDMIGAQYSVRTNNYTDKDGKTQYSQVLNIEAIDLKETKATTEARQAAKAAAAEAE